VTQPTDAQALTRLTLALSTQYTIERELGGGLSRVFLAYETALGRAVVVKVLTPELARLVAVIRGYGLDPATFRVSP
jgi:hypothetical protein